MKIMDVRIHQVFKEKNNCFSSTVRWSLEKKLLQNYKIPTTQKAVTTWETLLVMGKMYHRKLFLEKEKGRN